MVTCKHLGFNCAWLCQSFSFRCFWNKIWSEQSFVSEKRGKVHKRIHRNRKCINFFILILLILSRQYCYYHPVWFIEWVENWYIDDWISIILGNMIAGVNRILQPEFKWVKLADFLFLFCFVLFLFLKYGKSCTMAPSFRLVFFPPIRKNILWQVPRPGFCIFIYFCFSVLSFIFHFIFIFWTVHWFLFVNFFSLSRSACRELKALHVVEKIVASEFLHIKMGSGESHLFGTIRKWESLPKKDSAR